jgi:hypothetical protein
MSLTFFAGHSVPVLPGLRTGKAGRTFLAVDDVAGAVEGVVRAGRAVEWRHCGGQGCAKRTVRAFRAVNALSVICKEKDIEITDQIFTNPLWGTGLCQTHSMCL